MLSKVKKIINLVLSLLIVCSVFIIVPLNAFAANTADSLVSIAKGESGSSDYSKYYGGHKDSWCADFVTWCAQKAGVSSITNSSLCSTMYNGMINNGCQKVTSPQKGDLVFYTYGGKIGHVGIMIDSVNMISGNMVINEGETRRVLTIKYTSFLRGGYKTVNFVRPKYSGTTPQPITNDKVTNPWIKCSKTSLTVGESNTFTFGATNAVKYSIGIDRDGTRVTTETVTSGKSYKFYTPGNYTAYVTCHSLSGNNNVDSNKASFKVNPVPSEKTISDGEYLIALDANQNYCLAVDGDKTTAEANVQLWNNVKDNNTTSIVKVKYESDGYYLLTFKNSGKSLDVKDYGKINGTNVLQYHPTTNSNQRWAIKLTSDKKSFNIISKCSGMCLDAYNATAANGTNVQMYKGNGSAAQKWRFIASGLSTGQTIKDGKYKIVSAVGENLALDVKGGAGESQAVIQVYNRPLKDMSEFNVKYLGNGYYNIEYTKTNRSLDVKGNYAYKGVPIQLYDRNATSAQQWIIKYVGDGYYNIVSKGTGMYLDNAGAKTTNGNAVQGWLGNGAIAQKWRFIPASTTKSGSFNGHRYEYYRGKTNWTQAFKQCEKLGGHLVTINSKEENDYLVSLTNGYTGRIWTGGTTYYTSNWHWITSEAYEYENFKLGEPSSDEECYIDMYVSGDYAGQWNDEKVNNANVEGFVCEYDDTASGKDYQPAFSESYNNHYYEFYNDNIDWNTAKSFCEAKGGHLLTIQNSAENTFITSKISGLSRNEVWLGYSDIELEGSWKSVDGTAFSCSAWEKGNPDNHMGIEDCLVLTSSGVWGDLKTFNNINRNIGFVCEYDEPKPTESTTVAESETTEPVEIPTTTEAVTTEPVVNTETTTPVEVETSEPLTDNPTVLVKEVKGKSGEEVEVPVEISNNTGIIALTLDVTYDSSALKLTGVKDGGLLGTDIHKPEFTSPYTLSWANDNAQTDFNENGILATLCFEIKDTAKAGKYPISLSYDYDNYGTYNKEAQKVKLTLKNGSIEVDKIVYGDVNGDGTVNNLDRLYLTRYLANWEDYKNINKNNADVDCNGTVNNLDRLILTRYLANWSDYKILPYKK